MGQLLVSIAIIFKEENPYLIECLDHCLKLDYSNYEIILLPDIGVSSRLSEYIQQYGSKVKVVPTGKLNIPKKRNISVKHSSSQFVAFVDADAFPRKDWLKNAIPFFSDQSIGAVGGPNLTPPNDPLIRRIAGNVMKSKLVFGEGHIRHMVCPQQFLNQLPTCNLIVRKSLLDNIPFDEKLAISEDTRFCENIADKGFKILYSPKVIVFHHRRKIFLPFIKQFFNYGIYTGKLYEPKQTQHSYYEMPSLFFLFVVLGLVASFVYHIAAIAYTIIMFLYFIAILFEAVRNAKIFEIPLTWICIFIAQMSYGAGFILGYLMK